MGSVDREEMDTSWFIGLDPVDPYEWEQKAKLLRVLAGWIGQWLKFVAKLRGLLSCAVNRIAMACVRFVIGASWRS